MRMNRCWRNQSWKNDFLLYPSQKTDKCNYFEDSQQLLSDSLTMPSITWTRQDDKDPHSDEACYWVLHAIIHVILHVIVMIVIPRIHYVIQDVNFLHVEL